jgi:ATP-dependent Clp protease ATP-binding subunit ClpA
MSILRSVGIGDVDGLVNEVYPIEGEPLSARAVAAHLARVGDREPPRPGPIPPAFERFTAQARVAIIAAQRGDSNYAEPVDLLRGLLTVEDGVASRVLAHHEVTRSAFESDRPRPAQRPSEQGRWAVGSSTPLAPSPRSTHGRAEDHLRGRQPQLGQLYSDPTRRLIAEESLRQAFQHGHQRIGTGHLLLAIIAEDDHAASETLGDEDPESIRADVINALPGDET